MRKKSLTDRQKRFIDEYLLDLNATQAAIRAGYSRRRASEIGSKLVRKTTVAAAIRDAQDARARRTDVSADKVIRELARIAFSEMRTYASWGPDGVKLVDSAALAEDNAAVVAEISVNQFGPRIKLHPKLPALEKLGDHLGLWKRDPAELLEIFLASVPPSIAAAIRGAIVAISPPTLHQGAS